MTSSWGNSWGLAMGGGLIVNDGVSVEVSSMVVEVEIEQDVVDVEVSLETVEVELNDESILVEVEEW